MTPATGAEVVPEGARAAALARTGWLRLRFGIAARLTLVVIPLVLVPLGGLAYVWYSSTKATLELQVREELQVRLRQVALRLKPFLRERELDLYDLASSPALRDYHTQLDYRLVQEADVALKKLAEHFAQFLSRRDEVVAEARYLDETGQRTGQRDGSRRQEERRQLRGHRLLSAGQGPRPDAAVFASVEQSDTLQITVLRLALPVYNEWKEFRGVMVVDLPLSYFTVDAGGCADGPSGDELSRGRQRRDPRPAWGGGESGRAGGKGPASSGRPCARSPGRSSGRRAGRRGPRILVRAAVGAHGWSVGVLAPLVETEGPVRALTQSTLVYGSAGAVVLVLAVVLVARGASRRVRRLQAATAQLAEGHFGLRMPAEGTDEVADLGRSFNLMAESLARRDAELGARTEEAQRRRQELEVLNTVIQAAHTSLDLKESLEAIIDRLLALFDFSAGGIRLLNETGDQPDPGRAKGSATELCGQSGSLSFGRGRQRPGPSGRASPRPERPGPDRPLPGAGSRGPGGRRRPVDPDPVQGRGARRRRLGRASEAGLQRDRASPAGYHRPGGRDGHPERAPLQSDAGAAGGGGTTPGARRGPGGDRAVRDRDARPRPRAGPRGRARVRGDGRRCREHPSAGRRYPSLCARPRTVRGVARLRSS